VPKSFISSTEFCGLNNNSNTDSSALVTSVGGHSCGRGGGHDDDIRGDRDGGHSDDGHGGRDGGRGGGRGGGCGLL